MDHSAPLLLLILLFLCVVASLPAAMSINYSASNTYSHKYVYDPMPRGLTSHQNVSDSESMDDEVHEKRDLHALLSFRKAITSDPMEKLSNWTADDSENICSWSGIRCRKYTRRVVALDLYCFNLEGTLSRSLANLSLLRTLNLSGNSFTARIPPEFGELKELQEFQQRVNLINGSIPVELGMLHNLQILDLSSNGLTGRIPLELGQLKALRILNLSGNKLGGAIPVELGLLQKLEYTRPWLLDLGYNNIHSCIPQNITNLTNLFLLDLSNNKFTGKIPSHLDRLSGFVNASNNYVVSGEMKIVMKKYVYNLLYLWPGYTILDLSCNNLIGEIPPSIGSMSHLWLLNLSRNQLEGKIPATLGRISTLEQLDLANNNLSGSIPEELSMLHGLSILDVSSNKLCGRIPLGTQFSTFNVTSFQNNKCLWGCPLDSCSENEGPARETNGLDKRSNVKVGWLNHVKENISLVALGIGMGIGFGGVVTIFIFCKRAKYWLMYPYIPPQPFFGVYRFPK